MFLAASPLQSERILTLVALACVWERISENGVKAVFCDACDGENASRRQGPAWDLLSRSDYSALPA